MSNFIRVSLEENETSLYNISSDKNSRFEIIYTGHTYPCPSYSITRNGSTPSTAVEYIIGGKGYMTSNGKKQPVNTGDCILIKHHSHFTINSDSEYPLEKIWICVRGRLVDVLMDAYNLHDDIIITHADIYDDILKIHSIVENDGEMISIPPIFHSIIGKISSLYEISPSATRKNNISEQVYKIINENIFGDLCLDDIAARFFISKVQLIRVFKNDYGVTPYRYFLSKKIDVAKEFLKNTDMTVRSVGEKLGFSDEHYFSKIFKRIAGISPGQYKKL